MILISHFSRRFAKLLGSNPVSVLTTLILLSYTKILRTLIAEIHITYLEYPTYNRMVWLYDANIGYLTGKHIPLFSSVRACLFHPLYSLHCLASLWSMAAGHITSEALFMSQQCQAKTFHGFVPRSLQSKTLLLVCTAACGLLHSSSSYSVCIQYSGRPQDKPASNSHRVGNLFLWLWISGGVYTNKYVNILEGSFVLNLIILTTVTYYVKLFRGNQLVVQYAWITSVSVAFATFIGILVFQLANVTDITRCLKVGLP